MEDEDVNQQQDRTSSNLIRLDEISEQVSRQQIRNMDDIYRLTDEELDQKKILHPKMRDRRVLNVFRDLRTKLIQRAGKKNFSLLVTSICDGGGSSFVTTNLAASFALDHGKTALMVDCNLYSPSAEYLLDSPELGFSDFLENAALNLEEVIYATGIPRLRLIPAGGATDIGPEYYTSYRMNQFVEEVRNRYSDRYLFLDAPPIGNTADARILADLCDYVAIVVPYGLVSNEQIERAIESVSADKLVGLIFNN